MLEFQKTILSETIKEDGLLIISKGLGIDEITMNVIKGYSDPHQLVFVLNLKDEEIQNYIERLRSAGVPQNLIPKIINNEFPQKERRQVYLDGGCLFVTSRILIVDILNHRVPLNLVSGLVICNAHTIIENSNEAFIMSLLKQKNPKIFIKAFTENEYKFVSEFTALQKMMKMMFIENLFLWPRFHEEIVKVLDKNTPEVVEVTMKLTSNMSIIQDSIVDLIKSTLNEIKKINSDVDIDLTELTFENYLTRNFDRTIRNQIDKLGKKTKGYLDDLKTLRHILFLLLRYDCFGFYSYLESFRLSQGVDSNPANWLLTDEAQVIYSYAKSRVISSKQKKQKSQKTLTQMDKSEKREESKLILEENPKWKYILKILDEAKKEIYSSKDEKLSGNVLVITKTDQCTNFIKDYIEQGNQTLMNRYHFHQETQEKRKQNVEQSNEFITKKETMNEIYVGRKSNAKRKNNPILNSELPKSTKTKKSLQTKLDSISDHFEILESDNKMKVIIQHHAEVQLEKFRPSFIILYEPEISIIRKIEIFKAKNPGFPLRIYFMMYEGSIEEETYRNATNKEVDNFKILIDKKAHLSIPLETVLSQNQEKEKLLTLTQLKVIVDVREFRSALPCLLYDHGIEVIPISLAIGDFIVHPGLAIERKSPVDLSQSLNAGRLFTQAEKMLKHYNTAAVLIQFDEKESFYLVPSYEFRDKIQATLVTSKLALLTIHFPRLKIFWCRSPRNSVSLFKFLKKNQIEPDPIDAQNIGTGENDENEDVDSAIEVLKRMPGVTPQNVNTIINSVDSLNELSQLSYNKLTKLIGKQNAVLLYDFLNQDFFSK
eukprot:gene1747-516_t